MSLDLGADLPERGPLRRVYAEINRLRAALRRLQPVKSLNLLTHETSLGTAREAFESTGGTRVELLRLKQIGDDWLRCRSWGGTDLLSDDGDSDIYVARDPQLQRSRFDGKVINYASDGDNFAATFAYQSPTKRTKTIAGTPETQVVIPLYKVDFDLILAARCDSGVDSPSGAAIMLIELSSGRAWTKV